MPGAMDNRMQCSFENRFLPEFIIGNLIKLWWILGVVMSEIGLIDRIVSISCMHFPVVDTV